MKYRMWLTDPYDGDRKVKQITFRADGYAEAVSKAMALQKQYDEQNDTVTELNMLNVRDGRRA